LRGDEEGGRRGCPLSLPPLPITSATVARPRRSPQMMLVFSRFSPKKVQFDDTTEAVVVEAEAAARWAMVAGGRGGRRAVPLSLPLPPIAVATVARPRCPPQMMLVFSRFSPKKVPFEDTTEAVVVEAEAVARRATAAGGSGTAAGYDAFVRMGLDYLDVSLLSSFIRIKGYDGLLFKQRVKPAPTEAKASTTKRTGAASKLELSEGC
jgi:hypothetical protein